MKNLKRKLAISLGVLSLAIGLSVGFSTETQAENDTELTIRGGWVDTGNDFKCRVLAGNNCNRAIITINW